MLTAKMDLRLGQAVLIPAAADEREAAAALLTPGMVLVGGRNVSRYAPAREQNARSSSP
jgi:hypothetical protein